MRPVYLGESGLVSALGVNRAEQLTAMAGKGPCTRTVEFADGASAVLYAGIPFEANTWEQRARALLRRAMHADEDRSCPLILATSSYNLGQIEAGEAALESITEFASELARWLDWQGPPAAVTTACTSGMNALLDAAALIAGGEADEVLVVGFELFNAFSVAGFSGMQLTTSGAPRPFGQERQGIMLGESIATMRLSAKPTPWRLCGGAHRVDHLDATGASVASIYKVMQAALLDAGVAAQAIGLVKVQASGSPQTDAAEAQALQELFGQAPSLVSFKAALGHCLGACGVAELVLLLWALQERKWPLVGWVQDESLGVGLGNVAPHPLPRYLMAYVLGFGGSAASLVVEHIG